MKMKASTLVEDYDLYPRSQVDSAHVASLARSLEAGETLPPVIVDESSSRIIDGFHRTRAHLRFYGDNADIEVETRKYSSKKDMYLDAMRYNARHGKGITGSERTGAILKAKKLKISVAAIASSLGITQDRVTKITQTRVATVRQGVTAKGEPIALKRSVYHLAGRQVTPAQADVMGMLPGQSQALLLKQVRTLIETNSLDLGNDQVVTELRHLQPALAAITV